MIELPGLLISALIVQYSSGASARGGAGGEGERIGGAVSGSERLSGGGTTKASSGPALGAVVFGDSTVDVLMASREKLRSEGPAAALERWRPAKKEVGVGR